MLEALAFLGRSIRNLLLLALLLIALAAVLLITDSFRDPRVGERDFSSARSWGYQLQRVNLETLAQSRFDVVVIDYIHRASSNEPIRPSDIRRLAERPDGGRRFVLAYMSIGEAETYRFYWQSAWAASPPDWLGAENPRWHRNYAVRFWNEDWKRIIFGGPGSYLDRIIKAGFDGVYLDRVDAYVDWRAERPAARANMIEFVRQIAEEARRLKPGFKIVVQNAEELVDDAGYLSVIDALAKEDLLYGEKEEAEANIEEEVAYSIRQLNKVKAAGKPVWVIEYLTDPQLRETTARRLAELGFVPAFSTRALDRPGDP